MSEKSAEVPETFEKIRTWLIVFLMVVGILTYGIIVYVTIGDKGPPGWNYGAVSDVPGESPFSTESVK
jgi:hypothetical protein